MDKKFDALLHQLALDGVQRSVEGLSQMVGETLRATPPRVTYVPILKITNLMGGPETEAVGIYLRAEGEMSGQFMLLLPFVKALELVDTLMGDPPGTSQTLAGLGRSALAEVGNLTGAYFLNAVAESTGLQTVVSPPEVMMDMVGAILTIIVAAAADEVDEVIVITTNISHGERDVQASFWYVPDASAIEALRKTVGL